MSAGPPEMRWWNRLSLLWLTFLVGLSLLTRSSLLGGVAVIAGGLIQMPFGAALLANRGGFADRLAEYYSHRPMMLGGFVLNRIVWLQRVQGAAMLAAGLALVIFGHALILGSST